MDIAKGTTSTPAANQGRASMGVLTMENKPDENSDKAGVHVHAADITAKLQGLTAGPAKNKQGNFFDLLAAAVTAVKTDPGKAPEFQDYLQLSGVKMAWVRAIVALYEEPNKPDDPLSYILKLMGLGIPEITDVKVMQDKIKNLRLKLFQLQSENENLRALIKIEEQALEETEQRQELVSLFDDSKYFSDYYSDDDQYEMQSAHHRFSEK